MNRRSFVAALIGIPFAAKCKPASDRLKARRIIPEFHSMVLREAERKIGDTLYIVAPPRWAIHQGLLDKKVTIGEVIRANRP